MREFTFKDFQKIALNFSYLRKYFPIIVFFDEEKDKNKLQLYREYIKDYLVDEEDWLEELFKKHNNPPLFSIFLAISIFDEIFNGNIKTKRDLMKIHSRRTDLIVSLFDITNLYDLYKYINDAEKEQLVYCFASLPIAGRFSIFRDIEEFYLDIRPTISLLFEEYYTLYYPLSFLLNGGWFFKLSEIERNKIYDEKTIEYLLLKLANLCVSEEAIEKSLKADFPLDFAYSCYKLYRQKEEYIMLRINFVLEYIPLGSLKKSNRVARMQTEFYKKLLGEFLGVMQYDIVLSLENLLPWWNLDTWLPNLDIFLREKIYNDIISKCSERGGCVFLTESESGEVRKTIRCRKNKG